MKMLEMVIRPEKLEIAKEVLNRLNIQGMTVSMVSGCGLQKGYKRVYRGTEFSVNLLPKVKVEVVLHDSVVDKTVAEITAAIKTGEIGDGKIFIYNVENAVRIRTGERGDDAI